MVWKLLARLLVPIQEIRIIPVWAEATEDSITIQWAGGLDTGYYETQYLEDARITQFGEE